MSAIISRDGTRISVAPGEDGVALHFARHDLAAEVDLSPRQATLLADAVNRAVDSAIASRGRSGPDYLWADNDHFDVGNFGR